MSSRPHVHCPTCGATVQWCEDSPFRPFCSKRCRLIDLGKWADENHRIPGEEVVPGEEAALHPEDPLRQ